MVITYKDPSWRRFRVFFEGGYYSEIAEFDLETMHCLQRLWREVEKADIDPDLPWKIAADTYFVVDGHKESPFDRVEIVYDLEERLLPEHAKLIAKFPVVTINRHAVRR